MDVKRYSGDEVYGLYRGDLDERMVGTKDGEWMRFKQFNALREHAERLAEALEVAQFGFDHKRCSLCGGWNQGPNGETDYAHTKDCVIAVALAAYRKDHPKEQGR